MSYVCDGCQGANPVTVLITTLANGTTDASCNTDLPIKLIGQLAIWLEADPQALYDHIAKFTAELDAADAADQDETGEAAEPAKPPARRKPRTPAAETAEAGQ